MDHDRRFKILLQEYLSQFLGLFFPELLPYLDLSRVTWLQQELYPRDPHGLKLTVDLLVQVPLRSDAPPLPEEGKLDALLIHLEIESADTVEPFRKRMYDYYKYLTEEKGLKILPIAIYLRVGLEGIGKDRYVEKVLNRTILQFEYDYIGLPGLDGERYLNQNNPLAVAWSALMRWPRARRAQAAVEALERIEASPESPARKVLLCECVRAYAPLEENQRIELNSLLQEPQRQGVRAMIKTWTEEAREEGIKEGKREVLQALVETRFPGMSAAARQRLNEWPAERLVELGRALLKAQSLRELGLED
jgi:hypothetical protein